MGFSVREILELFSISKLPSNYKQAYVNQYNKNAIRYLQATMPLLLAYLIAYYYLDYLSAPEHYKNIWIIRTVGLFVPAVIVFVLSFTSWFYKYYQLIVGGYLLLGALSIEAMLLSCRVGELCYDTYFLGILIFNVLTIVMNIRLKNAIIIYFFSTLGFMLVMIFIQKLTVDFRLFYNRFLFFISMLTAYVFAHFFIEDSRIKSFLREIELEEQNEELAQQNQIINNQKSELEAQNEILEMQKKVLEEFNRKIVESINYARKIQEAMLPSSTVLSKYFEDWSLVYLPKETVSGDFYFWSERGDNLVLALADSTGHGVPGAFMSVLLMALLKEIINSIDKLYPDEILSILRKKVIETLKQDNSATINDGCDISLFVIDRLNRRLYFSGANMHSFLVTSNKNIEVGQNVKIISKVGDYYLVQLKATRQPISYYIKMKDFERVELSYESDDRIILFTDGVIDQFDSRRRKLTFRRFKDFVLRNIFLSPQELSDKFLEFFQSWKNYEVQIDDVTFFILKFK